MSRLMPLDMTKLTKGAAEFFYQRVVARGIVEDANIRYFFGRALPARGPPSAK